MSDNAKINAGMNQMGFEVVEHGRIELPSSTPATYEFTGKTTYQPDAFEDALDEHDFGVVGVNTKQKDNGDFYYYADVVTDHYKKVAVKVWKESANLYPKENSVDTFEFSRILHAIEDAFESNLEHRENNE